MGGKVGWEKRERGKRVCVLFYFFLLAAKRGKRKGSLRDKRKETKREGIGGKERKD